MNFKVFLTRLSLDLLQEHLHPPRHDGLTALVLPTQDLVLLGLLLPVDLNGLLLLEEPLTLLIPLLTLLSLFLPALELLLRLFERLPVLLVGLGGVLLVARVQ